MDGGCINGKAFLLLILSLLAIEREIKAFYQKRKKEKKLCNLNSQYVWASREMSDGPILYIRVWSFVKYVHQTFIHVQFFNISYLQNY